MEKNTNVKHERKDFQLRGRRKKNAFRKREKKTSSNDPSGCEGCEMSQSSACSPNPHPWLERASDGLSLVVAAGVALRLPPIGVLLIPAVAAVWADWALTPPLRWTVGQRRLDSHGAPISPSFSVENMALG